MCVLIQRGDVMLFTYLLLEMSWFIMMAGWVQAGVIVWYGKSNTYCWVQGSFTVSVWSADLISYMYMYQNISIICRLLISTSIHSSAITTDISAVLKSHDVIPTGGSLLRREVCLSSRAILTLGVSSVLSAFSHKHQKGCFLILFFCRKWWTD